MTKKKMSDLGMIEETDMKALHPPVYRGHSNSDLKVLRDHIKFWKRFPADLQNKNPDVRPIHPIQARHVWYGLVRKMVDGGTPCGPYPKNTLLWAFTIVGLDKQVESLGAKTLFEAQENAYPHHNFHMIAQSSCSISNTSSGSKVTCSVNCQKTMLLLKFAKKIFPDYTEEEIQRILGLKNQEPEITDIIIFEAAEMDDADEKKLTAEDELVQLFRSIKIEDVEKAEKEEVDRMMMGIEGDGMELD